MVLSGCATAQTRPMTSISDPIVSSNEPDEVSLVENGLRPQYGVRGSEAVTWTLQERMAHYKVPAVSIAVAIDGKLAWAKAYGGLSKNGEQLANTETLFQAASLSKPIASLAVLKLVQTGVLSLDKPVNDYLVRWKIPENEHTRNTPVTLRHLMSHRAGTTVHGFKGYKDGEEIPTLPQILGGIVPANTKAVKVNKKPGESYRYSGGGFTIMQLLIEDVTGLGYAQAVDKYVFKPAGLQRSNFDYPSKDKNAATGHAGKASDPIAYPGYTYPELAAAGLWTTPSQLVALGSQIAKARNIGHPFLDQKLARQIVPQSAKKPGLGFGLNNAGDGVAFVHNGHNPGFSARWINYADGRASVAVLTNSDSGGELVREIYSAIGFTYGWKQDGYIERDTVALSDQWMQDLTGSYSFSASDKEPIVKISVIDGELWIDGGLVEHTRFYPASKTDFFVTKGLNIKVETDANGVPKALNIEGEITIPKLPNGS